ncbi:hypothetical protein AVEN_268755-1 [Araneus ventricosus]|uniref:Uncharacterized protein n=1 Tax=Araneus ventricosus TaxID=182803 RepID=A0A4Y2HB01_ARAVE|nr:hypothetical protein AVEN_268755-1 [Araneus ventricosus]
MAHEITPRKIGEKQVVTVNSTFSVETKLRFLIAITDHGPTPPEGCTTRRRSGGAGTLVIRSGLRRRRTPCSKPFSTEDPPCLLHWCTLYLMCVERPPAGVRRKFGEGRGSSCVDFVI